MQFLTMILVLYDLLCGRVHIFQTGGGTGLLKGVVKPQKFGVVESPNFSLSEKKTLKPTF